MIDKAQLEAAFAANRERYLDEWREFLRFQSISADPEHHDDCLECAQWLTRHLEGMGLDARLLETPTKPVVFAEQKGRPGKPVVLFYGHYDVQPVDPLDAWRHPPFEPVLENGRMYARGAEDNKGQLFYVLKAVETLIHAASLDATVKVIVEGEEESCGHGIHDGLERWRDLVRADILMVCDTGTVRSGAPTIIMGLRGVVAMTVTLTGAATDLHSGVHGGVAPNAAEAMVRLLHTLRAPDGGIAVAGYYDGVAPPTAAERALANAVPWDEAGYRATTGVPAIAGENDYTPQERVGFRPTIEINGIHSGYGGAGGKTVIPARAVAKLSSRIVAGQDPEACLDAIERHLAAHVPPGMTLEISDRSAAGPGFRLNPDTELVARARAVLDQLSEHETALLWEGASIPIVARLAEVSGAEPLLVGFGRDGDLIHAPNESFSLEQLRMGYLYAGLFLGGL